MTTAESHQITDVVQSVQDWPPAMRIALARRILETLDRPAEGTSVSSLPRGLSAEEIAARFKTDRGAPDDATVQQWIEEYRMEKYGK